MTVAVASRVKDKVVDTKETVQVKAEEVKQQVSQGTEALQTKAGEVASQVKGLAERVRDNVPARVATRVEPLMTTARHRPLPTAAVAVVVVLVLRLVLQRLLRRNS